ncbi:DUF4469 domain-containing protein [Candidatus Electrothrix aarhusensis]|jgi:hypothetical protein
MSGIQWRPEVNALTTPKSYRIRYVPRDVIGYEELAAEISTTNPNYNEALVNSILHAFVDKVQEKLLDGVQVTLEDGFTFRLSFIGRLDEPTDPLPDNEDMLQMRVYASQPFVREVRQQARFERLPAAKKAPVIASSEDTRTKLNNVLNPVGVLRMTGSNLFFDENDEETGCIIEGTRSGSAVQQQFGVISNSVVLAVPDIPAQNNPWNNEYIVSITTRYTEHGSLRTGVFGERLRSPLAVEPGNSSSNGILTGKANNPYVRVEGASISESTARIRIRVILNRQSTDLLFSLLDMKEGGQAGPTVTATADGDYTLAGFSGSVVSSLDIRVENFQGLSDLLREDYSDSMTDILDITPGT